MALFSRIPFDKKQIENAIAQFEQQSSAELRVYIERKVPKTSKNLTAVERNFQLFQQLEMEKTHARNGVLIYIAFKAKQCAIIGDQGIHQYVGQTFWQQQCELLISYFEQKKFTEGVIVVIQKIGQELALHFPIQPDDQNELPNEVIIQ